MKSMTGHGRGERAGDGYKITVELGSVNRRQGEVAIHLPREMEALEAQIRNVINPLVARGRLTVRVTLESAGGLAARQMRLNMPLARAYVRELKRLAKELRLPGDVTLETLARAPGVLQADGQCDDAEHYWPVLEAALGQALQALLRMRDREGAHLAADLRRRIRAMQQAVRRIEKRAPHVLVRYREGLRERIAGAGLPTPGLDDERLLREIVYFTDRSDISEELSRLQSHFVQFDDCLKLTEPVGRTLDFLAQEMHREVNTIGSKANDSVISREVVLLKAETEKFREQAQNVE
jgi:uncharacterized protein (TIGR00255 family)